MRLDVVISSHINMYCGEVEGYGEPLPETLNPSHKGAHFMTLDKIVSEFIAGDVFFQEMNVDAIKSFKG